MRPIVSGTRWMQQMGRRTPFGVWHLDQGDHVPICGRGFKENNIVAVWAMAHAEPVTLGKKDRRCERCRRAAVGTVYEGVR